MQHFLLIATVAMISEKLFFPTPMTAINRKTSSFLLQNHAAYQSKLKNLRNGVKNGEMEKWSQTDR